MTQIFDRIKETCTVTGLGGISLLGADNNSFLPYGSRYPDGSHVPYCLVEALTSFEIGIGVISASGTLITRTSLGVVSSTNGDSLVNFTGGNKECFASLTSANILEIKNRVDTNASNISLLHFYRAIDNGLSVQKMVDGFVDEYEDETNVASKVGAIYDSAGKLYTNKPNLGNIIPTVSFSLSSSVTAQESTPLSLVFKPDGTKLFMLGTDSGGIKVYEYSLATPWLITSKIFTVGYTPSNFMTNTLGMLLSADGLKLYILNQPAIAEYSLALAWDLSSTITFIATTTIVGATTNDKMFISPDGLNLYLTDASNNLISQFTLTIPWSISGGHLLINSYDISSFQVNVKGVHFKEDGLKLFINGRSPDAVFQISLSVAWDLSSTNKVQGNFSTTPQTTTSNDLFISSDGIHLFILEDTGNNILDYTLPKPWTLLAEATETFSVPATASGIVFSLDGTKLFIANKTNNAIEQYSTTTPFKIAPVPTLDGTLDVSGQQGNITGLAFSPDGTKLLIVGSSVDRIDQYGLSVAWDLLSTVNHKGTLSLLGLVSTPQSLYFKDDGTKAYVVDSAAPSKIVQLALIKPWTVANELEGTKSVPAQSKGIAFNTAGTKAFVIDDGTDIITQYDLSTPWDLVQGVTTVGTLDVSAQQSFPTGLFVSSDGTKLYIIGQTTKSVHQYTLTVPGTITGGTSLDGSFDTTALGTAPSDIHFSSDGTKMYICHAVGNEISQSTLTTPWDVTGTVTSNGSLAVSAQLATPRGLAISSDGLTLLIAATSSVYRYTLTTPWDITGTVSFDASLDLSPEFSLIHGIALGDAGNAMYLLDVGKINQYTLLSQNSPDAATTADGNFNVSSESGSPTSALLYNAGKNMILSGNTQLRYQFFQYILTTPWDLTGTVTLQGTLDSVDTAGSINEGLFLSPDGRTLFAAGGSIVQQIDLIILLDSFVLESAPALALTQPETGSVILLQEDVSTITLNVDLVASVSRDGGVTYTEGVLVNKGPSNAGKNILSCDIALRDQPAGSSLICKLECTEAEIKLHGTGLQWR